MRDVPHPSWYIPTYSCSMSLRIIKATWKCTIMSVCALQLAHYHVTCIWWQNSNSHHYNSDYSSSSQYSMICNVLNSAAASWNPSSYPETNLDRGKSEAPWLVQRKCKQSWTTVPEKKPPSTPDNACMQYGSRKRQKRLRKARKFGWKLAWKCISNVQHRG